MSMNFSLGCTSSLVADYGAEAATKLDQPALRWVFVDEHPDSINNGFFTVYLNQNVWQDLPASSHNGACGFAFADGHSEIKSWLEASTRKADHMR